jgi:signal transduction histidine kinase
MLTRLRWSAFGLRGRIVGMVLVTTIATLLVAAAGLLPRLESSLQRAAKLTVVHDVGTKNAQHELRKLNSVDYVAAAELAYPTLGDRALQADAQQARGTLLSDVNGLAGPLGATQLFLYGYIDLSGQGKIVPVEHTAVSQEPLASNAIAYGTSAWLKGQDQVRLATINNKQYVVEAIPLRRNDGVVIVYKSIDYISDAVSTVRQAFELAAGAGLLLTLLLAIPLAATLVRRLQRLREAALRVAVAGAGAKFPVDRARDEVGDLARSFAIMQRRLRHQEEARRAFVATASHELRTPLASLDGMLELLAEELQEEDPDLPDAQELLDRARAQSRRLGRLAADLLDLSRIDAEVTLRSEPVELGELARAVLAEFELAFAERGVAPLLREGPVPVWALGDPGSVARILRILLDNGLRVAPRGSDIVVALAAQPIPTLSVIDRGPGVAVEERALIFERFKRGRDTGGEAGFGLGLAIGRELAERMGGALVLANSAQPGATFTLTLPAAQAPLSDRLASAAGV